jgi:hypothetical protein
VGFVVYKGHFAWQLWSIKTARVGFVVYKGHFAWDLWSINSPVGFVVYIGHFAWDLRTTTRGSRGICGLRRALRAGFVVYKNSPRGIYGLERAFRVGFEVYTGLVGFVVYTGQSVWNLWSSKWQRDSVSKYVLQLSPVSIIPPALRTHISNTIDAMHRHSNVTTARPNL